MESEQKGLDYGGGNIPGLFRILLFPTLAAMVSDAMFVIVDGIFGARRGRVGHSRNQHNLSLVRNSVGRGIDVWHRGVGIGQHQHSPEKDSGVAGLLLAIPLSELLTLAVILGDYRMRQSVPGISE